MDTGTTPSSSWADETEELESAPKTRTSAWEKPNPWVAPINSNESEYSERNEEPYEERRPPPESRSRERDYYNNRKENRYEEDYPRERNYPREQGRPYNRERDYESRPPRGGFNNRRPASYGSRDRPPREKRAPVPFPSSPPYTAFVGNLPFNVIEEDLHRFFEKDCRIVNVRLVTDRETNRSKGFGYVEFEDLDSLKNAVERDNEPLFEREIKIDVAEAKPDNRSIEDPRRNEFWNKPRTNGTPYRSNSQNRESEPSPPESKTQERPKLELKPRSSTTPSEPQASEAYKSSVKANPFGAAKPRDENLFLKKKEEERKVREEPQKENESPAEEPKRAPRDERPPREDRPPREERQPREDRPPRERQSREERPPREDRPPREFRKEGFERRENFDRRENSNYHRDNRDNRERDNQREDRSRPKTNYQDRNKRFGGGNDTRARRPDQPKKEPKREDKPAAIAPVVNQNMFSALGEE